MPNEYGTVTVRQLVEMVSRDKKHFPKGLDTPVTSGDFEGNYWHRKHGLMIDDQDHTVFLGYEMHEGAAGF